MKTSCKPMASLEIDDVMLKTIESCTSATCSYIVVNCGLKST
jgi:hypothetical protein